MSWNPSTAKCDFPFLNESKGSAFWQGMITFFRIIFYSLPAPPLAIGALLLFSFFSYTSLGMIKDRNSRELTEAEEIKKRWQNTLL